MENNIQDKWTIESCLFLSEKIRGVSYSKEVVMNSPKDGYIPILRANNISEGIINYLDLVYVPNEYVSTNQILKEGDVVIAMSSGSKNLVGKAAQFFGNERISFGAFCGVLRPKLDINPRFFGYYFQSKEYREKISNLSSGTNINNLKAAHFESIQVPTPPISEQHRIVAKLDAFFEKIEANKKRLEKIPQILKRFRQSVLEEAVSGRLTEGWRTTMQSGENASKLLNDIINDRFNNRIKEGNNSKKKHLPDSSIVNLDDIIGLPGIPPSWIWVKGKILFDKIFDGTHFSPVNKSSGDYPYITAKNIKEWGIDLSNLTFVSASDHKEIYKRADVKKNDILYIKDGATAGIAVLNTLDYEFSLLSSVGVFRCNVNHIEPLFFVHFLNGLKERILENISGVAITRLTLEKLNNLLFCLPPQLEQKEIVKRVEGLFAYADKIEARYTKAKAMLDKLPQTILAKAFRGELVARDVHDEPVKMM